MGMEQNASKLFSIFFFFFFFKDTCLFLYVALTYTYKEKQHEIQNLQYLVDLFDLLVKALSRDMMCWA